MKIHTLPPEYSVADMKRKAALIQQLAEIHRHYMKEAEPIQEALAEIEARYAPRCIIEGDAGDYIFAPLPLTQT